MSNSTNERAQRIVGMRDTDLQPFDQPHSLGYWCPVCKFDEDEFLDFSEYNGFLWCERCNKDFPSAICKKNPEEAIGIYLDAVEEAIARAKETT